MTLGMRTNPLVGWELLTTGYSGKHGPKMDAMVGVRLVGSSAPGEDDKALWVHTDFLSPAAQSCSFAWPARRSTEVTPPKFLIPHPKKGQLFW